MSLTLISLLTVALVAAFSRLCATEGRAAGKPQRAAAGQAQPAPGADPKVSEAMRPGPEHARLGQLVGTWDVSCTMWMTPDAPPAQSQGTTVITSLHEGRHLQADFTGSFMGKPFAGQSTMGYDRAAERYFTTWHDNMSTGFCYLTGTSSDGGRTITTTAEGVCPQLGPLTMRQVQTHESADRFTQVSYNRPHGGEEFKCMELVYTRRA